MNDPSNEQEDGSDEKGQGGVGVVIGVKCDQDRTDDKIQESSNPDKNKNPNISKKIIARQLPLIKHRHSSIYYHSAFKMYPRHKRPENMSSDPEELDSLQKLFSARARVSTVSISNAIVESWNQGKKPSFLSLPPLTQESNLGDDGLTLQSTYDVNINDKEYQESLKIDISLLGETMPPHDQLKKHYTKLLQGASLMKQMTLRGETLTAVRRRGELMNLRIVDVSAKNFMLQIDDAEFQDWCSNNLFARFWYCSQVKNSPILQRAIKNSIQKSPHPQLEKFFDNLDDMPLKFVGFVTAQIQDKVLKAFHIHSFALYYMQNMRLSSKETSTTVVICVLTSRIHIRSMMQDRVLQLLQLLQHEDTQDYSMSLTNQFIGTDVILNDSSKAGYWSMGFNVESMTQDIVQGQFTINTDYPIPLMPYSDRYTWAKYGHDIN